MNLVHQIELAPIDRIAARIIRPGIHFEPKIKRLQNHSPEIVPTDPYLGPKEKNLIGLRFHNFTVIGFLKSKRHEKMGPLWLVRCVCGEYTSRRSKSLNNPKNKGDKCDKCRHIDEVNRHYYFLVNGFNID